MRLGSLLARRAGQGKGTLKFWGVGQGRGSHTLPYPTIPFLPTWSAWQASGLKSNEISPSTISKEATRRARGRAAREERRQSTDVHGAA